MNQRARVIGSGWCVPETIRKNDDPIFDWIRANIPPEELKKMFRGYVTRHVLSEGEHVIDIMVPAAEMALKNAGLRPEDVDILLGMGSVAEFTNPNTLSLLHQKLGLNKSVWALPIANVYSNFNSSMLIADGLIAAGHVKTALICVGGNWTRNVSYHTPQAVSAGDGAGAVVMAASEDSTLWQVKDVCTLTETKYYGGMYTGRDSFDFDPPHDGHKTLYSDHYFHINDLGKEGFKDFGIQAAADSVIQLIEKHNIPSSEITLMPNQSSAALLEPWLDAIKPGQNIDTMTTFANMTVATTGVNLGWAEERNMIENDKVVMMALGPDMHTNSILLERNC